MMPYNMSFRRLALRYTKFSPKELNKIEDLTAGRYQLMEEKRIFKSILIKNKKKRDILEDALRKTEEDINNLLIKRKKDFDILNRLYMRKRFLAFREGHLIQYPFPQIKMPKKEYLKKFFPERLFLLKGYWRSVLSGAGYLKSKILK